MFLLFPITIMAILYAGFVEDVVRFPIEASTRIKHERAANAESPRAIFVGGSNLLFTLDSTVLKARTGFEPINMGQIGGLRLNYLLAEAEHIARGGDLVVLALEYQHLTTDPHSANLQILARVIEARPANYRYVSLKQWKRLLDHGIIEHLHVVLSGIVLTLSGVSDRQHVLNAINQYGDLTLYHDMAKRRKPPGRVMGIGKPNVDALEQLNTFQTDLNARGIEVAYTYPPVSQTVYEARATQLDRFHRLLDANTRVPIWNTPEHMVLADRFSLDDRYHFFGDGVRIRTERMVDLINERTSQN